MSWGKQVLVLVFVIVNGSQLSAQTEPNLSSKISQLLEIVNEQHIQPEDIDDAFVAHMHKAFVDVLDADQIVFSSEDLDHIQSYAAPLSKGIRMQVQAYLDSVYVIWSAGIDRAKTISDKFFQKPFDPEVISDSSLFSDAVPEAKLELKLTGLLRSQIFSEALNLLEEENFDNDKIDAFLDSAFHTVESRMDDYFKNIKLEQRDLEEALLNAVAETIDPHSSYFSASTNKAFKEELSRKRELFGITYTKNTKGELEISNVMPGSSAWLSGEVHVGDQLMEVDFGSGNKFNLKGKTSFQLGKLFDDFGEQEIILKLKSGNETERLVTLVKSKVYSDSDVIKAAVLDGEKKVGFISLPDFYTNWNDESDLGCANDLAKTIIKLKQENIEGIILDLRDNGGGSLGEAVDLSGIFIDYGPILVTDDASSDPRAIKDLNRGLIFSGPLVVMVNGYSASASEVVAGVLQDYNRALIVGSKSFGKATGQQILPIAPSSVPFGSEAFEAFGYAKVTNVGLYRISLETNQIRGVIPDIELPIASSNDFFGESDYERAIRLDSIDKKMYYTPKRPLEIAPLRSSSATRVQNDLNYHSLDSILTAIENLNDGFDPHSENLSGWIEFEKKWKALDEMFDARRKEYEVSFTPQTISFDSEVYKMDSVLKMYNERFLERLQSDIDLSETYEIINQMINQ